MRHGHESLYVDILWLAKQTVLRLAGVMDKVIEDTGDTVTLTVAADAGGERLDKYLVGQLPAYSRTRLKALIETGQVTLGDTLVLDAAHKVRAGDVIEVMEPEAIAADPSPQNIPLDIVYEDDDLLVINKAADMVVHPAVGHHTGTLVNALLYHCGDSLSGIGGVKRPGIVHRLDRGTSGLMLAAKNDAAHLGLQKQLSDRTLGRIYHAVTFRIPVPPAGTIDKPIGRHPTQRLKMTVGGQASRAAVTHYKTLSRFGDVAALIECRLQTGRTHQIRVHMASLGYPLIGDPLYGAQTTAVQAGLKKAGFEPDVAAKVLGFGRQALHAHEIHFIHPVSGEAKSFQAEGPDDWQALVNTMENL
jgi:23S rRNA pseudouridine1911/1915/1917 synthase